MSKTMRDIINDLKRMDEVTLLELLNLSSEDIVDRFEDVIENRYDVILDFLGDDDSEEEDLQY
jgi:hypothetical protein